MALDMFIVADRRLAVFGVEFGRSIGQFHADGQLAVLDGLRGGGQLGQLVILLDGAHIVTNGGVLRLESLLASPESVVPHAATENIMAAPEVIKA